MSPALPKLLVFASGTAKGGGSGFEKLVEAAREGTLRAELVGVVSNHAEGGVRVRAERLGVPFVLCNGPWSDEAYRAVVRRAGAEWIALSGWLKKTAGLDPRRTINIHPGPLPEFGGLGLYGRHVHEAVIAAHAEGRVARSAVSMHFVTDEYDRGPVFFEHPVPILPGDTAETLGARAHAIEHEWQARITNLVVQGAISWDGRDPASLRVPPDYAFLPARRA